MIWGEILFGWSGKGWSGAEGWEGCTAWGGKKDKGSRGLRKSKKKEMKVMCFFVL